MAPHRTAHPRYATGWTAVLLLVILAGGSAVHSTEHDSPIIEIVPPREVTAQRLRIETLVTSERIERVDFVLDERLLATDHSFPFSVRVDARVLARGHLLEALAFDGSGVELTRDRLPLDGLSTRLRISTPDVRVLENAGWWEISAEVAHPSNATVERVDFYRDEHFAASTRHRPFTARIPRDETSAYVRAVAHLDGGGFTESVRMLQPGAVEHVLAVNLVEIYAMVSDRQGRPVTRLERDDFTLHEGGRSRSPERFAIGDDVPLSVALVLDRSGSMFSSMGRAKQAARMFLKQALDEHDKALLVDFASRPRLLQGHTGEIDDLLGQFDAISSKGGSAVYDAILFSLIRLNAARGRKALIVLTDGLDSGSRATVEDCAAMARRSGVPIFVVSMGDKLEHRPSHRSFAMQRLADTSGGQIFTIAKQDQLTAAYTEIDRQLRGQYLLAFSTGATLAATELESLRLTVADKRLKVRTILGGQIQIMD